MKPASCALAIAAFAGAAALSQAALAQERGFYLGGSLGQATLTEWCDTTAAPPGFTLPACDDSDTAWKFFGGYRVNRYFAIEASYVNWGEVSGVVRSPTGQTLNISAEQWSTGVAVVGTLPLGPQFSVFAKAGFLKTEQEIRRSTATSSSTVEGDEDEFHYGLGATFRFTRNWAARVEWESTEKQKLEAQMFSLGVEFRF
jgi:OOP family OmpA-OmpF porin